MTPTDAANHNVALGMTILAIVGALAYAGWKLLYSEHPIAVRLRRVMSRLHILEADEDPLAQRLPATKTSGGQGTANTGNPVKGELPGNTLPEELREIVRFWANVDAVEAVVRTGKLGQVEAIEAIFRCKRSGRPDSPYARAHAAVTARLAPARYRVYTEEEKTYLAAPTNGHE
jgi:hypothetical protein